MKFRKNLRAKKLASKGMAKAGFTLIELIVVIAILGILVLLAAPRFLGYTKDANVSTMQADSKVLANAALVYNVEKEDWPTTASTVEISIADETGLTLKALDQTKISEHVQTLKGDLADYALVTDNTGSGKLQEGDIVYVGDKIDNGTKATTPDGKSDGVEGRNGTKHFGSDIKK